MPSKQIAQDLNDSIKEFQSYMAEKSLRESSETPTNIAAAQAAAEAYSATHTPTTTIDPSTAVTQAEALLESTTVEETPNPLPVVPPLAETEKEALREKFLNLEQETAGESEFEEFKDLEQNQLTQAQAENFIAYIEGEFQKWAKSQPLAYNDEFLRWKYVSQEITKPPIQNLIVTGLKPGPVDGIEIAKGVTKQVAREGVDMLNLIKLGGKLYWALLKVPFSNPESGVELVLHDYTETDQALDDIEWLNPSNGDQSSGKIITQLATFMSPAAIKNIIKAGAKALTDISSSFLDPKNITRENISKLLQLSEKTATNPSVTGHTFQKHVAKSDEDLIKRVQDNILQKQRVLTR